MSNTNQQNQQNQPTHATNTGVVQLVAPPSMVKYLLAEPDFDRRPGVSFASVLGCLQDLIDSYPTDTTHMQRLAITKDIWLRQPTTTPN
jgi:hypothetical protein